MERATAAGITRRQPWTYAQGPPDRTSIPARERPCGSGHRPATPGTRTSWSWSRCSGGWWAPGCATGTRSTTWSRRRWPGSSPPVSGWTARRSPRTPSSPPATWSPPWPGSRSGAGATGRAWVDLSEPERPEDAALRQEEAAAVEAALAGCPTTSARRWWPTRSRGSTPPPWPRPGARPRARTGSSWPGPGPGCASTTCWPCAGSSCPPPAAGRCCWPCGGCGGGSRPGRGSARCWPR
jgi:hypothetical protein